MSWVFLITLVVLGLIAAADKVRELIPQSKGLTDFLKDASGWVGLVAIFLGLYWLGRLLWYIGPMWKYAFFTWLIATAASLVMLALGLVFAKGQLNEWTGSNEKVNGPLQKVWGLLEPKQEMLGLLSLILAIVYLVRTI